MRFGRRKDYEIFNPVIVSYSVDMVYHFFGFKISPKMFFHYKTMFWDISMMFMERMILLKNIDISTISFYSSALVVGWMSSSCWTIFSHFLNGCLAMMFSGHRTFPEKCFSVAFFATIFFFFPTNRRTGRFLKELFFTGKTIFKYLLHVFNYTILNLHVNTFNASLVW